MSFAAGVCVLLDIDPAIRVERGSMPPCKEIDMNTSLARRCRRTVLGLAAGAALCASASAAEPLPVLLVIANQDFHYAEYAAVRVALEAQDLQVVVAAGNTRSAIPQGPGLGLPVQPERALAEARAEDHSAIVFVGGWGASSYQYAFSGTYANGAYQPQRRITAEVNRLVGEFIAKDKPTAAVDHGVTVLAWARVDGVSPLQGRIVAAGADGMPGFRSGNVGYPDAEVPMRWQIERNGATQLTSGSIGHPLSTTDDVWVDGHVITAENYDSASRFAELIAQAIAPARD
jgi:putative intracellular protease/amidase